MLLDAELRAPFLERVVSELPAVVRDESPWYAKSADYAFSKEFLDRPAANRVDGLGLYPLSEVINGYHQVFVATWSSGKRPQQVNLPLEEWPRATERNHFLSGGVMDWGV